jgi:hypothetical protein
MRRIPTTRAMRLTLAYTLAGGATLALVHRTNGHATDEELAAARDVAVDAAWDAAWDAQTKKFLEIVG